MTLISKGVFYSSAVGRLALFTKANPASGNIVASFSGQSFYTAMCSVLVNGTTSTSWTNSSFNTVSVNTNYLPMTTASTDLVVDVVAINANGIVYTVGPTQTKQVNTENNGSVKIDEAMSTAPGVAGSMNMSWGFSASGATSQIALALKGM
jgi:hypothetical protein